VFQGSLFCFAFLGAILASTQLSAVVTSFSRSSFFPHTSQRSLVLMSGFVLSRSLFQTISIIPSEPSKVEHLGRMSLSKATWAAAAVITCSGTSLSIPWMGARYYVRGDYVCQVNPQPLLQQGTISDG